MVAIGSAARVGAETEAESGPAGLFLLFDKGGRPERARFIEQISAHAGVTVSHDPVSVASKPAVVGAVPSSNGMEDDWIELLVEGLTFDILGLAAEPTLSIPEVVGGNARSVLDDADGMEAIAVYPGPHISAGAHTIPVVRRMLSLGSALISRFSEVRALIWTPSRVALSPSTFTQIVDGWIAGGPFPSLGLTRLELQPDGTMVSRGLSFFIGQEIELAAALTADKVSATRLVARLMHELVASGPQYTPVEVLGEAEARYRLEPTPDGALIRIWPA